MLALRRREGGFVIVGPRSVATEEEWIHGVEVAVDVESSIGAVDEAKVLVPKAEHVPGMLALSAVGAVLALEETVVVAERLMPDSEVLLECRKSVIAI